MQAEIDKAASPKLSPGSLGVGNSGTKLSRSPGMRNHLARVECGIMQGKSPVDLNRVAQVTTDNRRKTNCDARWTKVHRAVQMACQTGSPSVAKAVEQTSQPRDHRNTGRRKFFGSSVALSQTREGEG